VGTAVRTSNKKICENWIFAAVQFMSGLTALMRAFHTQLVDSNQFTAAIAPENTQM